MPSQIPVSPNPPSAFKRFVANNQKSLVTGIFTVLAAFIVGVFGFLGRSGSPSQQHVLNVTNSMDSIFVAGNQTGNNTIKRYSFAPSQTIYTGSNSGWVYNLQFNNQKYYFESPSNVVPGEQLAASESNRAVMATTIHSLVGKLAMLEQQVVRDAVSSGYRNYTNRDYSGAFQEFLKAVKAFESNPDELKANKVELSWESKASIYCYTSLSALALGSNSIATEFADKTIQLKPSAPYMEFIVGAFYERASEKFRDSDFSDALKLSKVSIKAYRECRQAEDFRAELLSPDDGRNFYLASRCAQRMGDHETANDYAEDAVRTSSNAANLANLVVTRHNVALEKWLSNDFDAAFRLFVKDVEAYRLFQSTEGYKPDLLPAGIVSSMLNYAAFCAGRLGKQELMTEFLEEAAREYPSITNLANVVISLHNLGREIMQKATLLLH